MTIQEFRSAISKVTSASSLQGKDYTDIAISGSSVHYSRESGSKESISLDELYKVYQHCTFIDTNVVRSFITGRKRSPAVAILIASGLYDDNGYRRTTGIPVKKNDSAPPRKSVNTILTDSRHIRPLEKPAQLKDEDRFFAGLQKLLGKYLISKSIKKPVGTGDIVLNKEYHSMQFPPAAVSLFEKILKTLNSDFNFSGQSISRHVDGMCVGHPILKTRIIEFDEEQHFSPARAATIDFLKQEDNCAFASLYYEYLQNRELFRSMLQKHRLRSLNFTTVPTFKSFICALSGSTEISSSGYIEAKSGFPYLGGRIAQRAYYDLLRDMAHLSGHNKGLSPVIRFPKFYFETLYKKDFSKLSESELTYGIKIFLKKIYSISI